MEQRWHIFLTVVCSLVFLLTPSECQLLSEISFSEGSTIGTRRLLDIEEGKFTNANIADGNEDSTFQLHHTVDNDRPDLISFVHLETIKALDREKKSNYDLQIKLTSLRGPEVDLRLLVQVLDINDNPPMFEKDEYHVTVNKSINVGASLVQVQATDVDSGINSELSYHMPDKYSSHFHLDHDTGILETKSSFMCNNQDCPRCIEEQLCSILIYAKDGGQPQQSAYTVVKVHLLDSNDHDPEITFRFLPDQSKPYSVVTSSAKAGTSVAAVSVTDHDNGIYGETELTLVAGNEMGYFKLFSFGSNLYVVRTTENAKFSGLDNIVLKFQARDGGSPPRLSTGHMEIRVEEKNDFEPKFEQDVYEVEISESVAVGSSVYTVIAEDGDHKAKPDPNGMIYSISSGDQLNWFSIEPLSGLITTRSQIDREEIETLELQIRVQDRGSRPKSAFATLKIQLLDENDEAPKFEDGTESQIEVSEDTALHTVVHRVKAIDLDEGRNGTVFFSIDPNPYFAINNSSGEVFVKSSLDHESAPVIKLDITASDQGITPQSSVHTLNVQLLDVNDNSPTFYPTKKVIYLDPKSQREFGKPVLQVQAQDKDSDAFAQISYAWHDAPTYLSLNRSSGTILLRPNQRIYPTTFSISAKDNGGRKSPKHLQVQVVTENFHQDKSDLTFKVNEMSSFQPRHQALTIGTVVLDEDLEGNGDFEILDGDPSNFLELVASTGELRTRRNLDREVQDEFRLEVGYFQANSVTMKNVVVQVQDINDNRPEFQDKKDSEIIVDRSMPSGSNVYKVPAFDKDEGDNGKLHFALDDPLNELDIDQESGIIILKKGLTHIPGDITREIRVQVSDFGAPKLSNSKNYRVSYLQLNAHTPRFDFEEYEISVSENTLPNSIIKSVIAVDEDSGLNGKISYAITTGAKDVFGVFPDGNLYLKQKLDREEGAYYSIGLAAKDQGEPPRSSEVSILIYVLDENDNAPQFLSKNYIFDLYENEEAGSVIGRVTATDKDVGRNADLEYYFATPSNYIHINPITGFITSLVSFDREHLISSQGQDFFHVDVFVRDKGIISLSDTASVNIVVKDKNDNRPQFSEKFYQLSLSEGTKLDSEVFAFHAHDKDKGDNGKITFSISKNPHFRIDKDSGVLILDRLLDRESLAKLSVLVTASDNGNPPQSSNVTLYVKVLDENDNSPTFPYPRLEMDLQEDAKPGHIIYQFRANDLDEGQNGKIFYTLGGTSLRNSFSLDAITGILMLKNELDREVRDTVDLIVTATDAGTPARSTSVPFVINVLDANDNSPMLPTTPMILSVKENIPIGSQVFKVEATDPDEGLNGEIVFELRSTDVFRIESQTGVIRTAKNLDRETQDKYEFIVVASDRGKEPRSSEKTITIDIEDANDSTPQFESLPYTVLLPGSVKGTSILDVKAVDDDLGSNGEISYRIQSTSNSKFPLAINETSGRLYLTQDVLNPERGTSVYVIVATDNAVQSARLSSTSTVTVIAGSEIPGPSFTKQFYQTSIKENRPIGTPLISVSLSDFKNDANYYIVGCQSQKGRHRNLFHIDQKTGQISSSKIIDREVEGSKIVLDVIAIVDDKMSGCKVDITCLDENDSAPKFVTDQDIFLSEEHLPGHLLAYVKAEDADMNPQISYSLSLSSQTFFEVNSLTGALSVIHSIDQDAYPYFELEIFASDGIHTTAWKKNLKVHDINDNAPTFDKPQFSFDIHETAKKGALVGRIEAFDADSDENLKKVSYQLVSDWGSDTFSIDPSSGVLTVSALELDHEEVEHYILIASARDGGEPPLTATTTIYINILDVNDNAPRFEQNVYRTEILEDSPEGSVITQIQAFDPDTQSSEWLRYEIEEAYAKIFAISNNGTLTLKSKLDREEQDFYAFHVEVKDGSPNDNIHLTGSCLVEVTVGDINDFVPQIELPPVLKIAENSPPNSPIIKLAAIDRDIGRNAEVHFSLLDDQSGKFSIGKVDSILRSHFTLDREEKALYDLTIVARDKGHPSLSSVVNIEIQVEDLNDNVPIFNPKYYTARIYENASIGMSVLQIKATDLDIGQNGRIKYSIVSGNSDEDFLLDETTGDLRVNKGLDHEWRTRYDITVQAQDDGGESHSDTATVSITVLDVNDNPPRFLHSPYLTRVLENTPRSLLPLTLFRAQAVDQDSEPNNRIEYSLRDSFQGLFSINATTGSILLHDALDREETPEFNLEIMAQDLGTPQLSSTGILNVNVVDINDNAPIFENDVYEFQAEENLPVGVTIGKVHAADLDDGLNGKIRYSLMDLVPFSIDEETGDLRVGSNLDREVKDMYEFTVQAVDSSPFSSLKTLVPVTVHIEDVNDQAPEIVNGNADFFISPNAIPNSFVLGVDAFDKDKGRNSEMSFSMSGRDADHFYIDSLSGVVLTSSDFSQQISYEIDVLVSDNGQPSLSSVKRFEIFLAKELSAPDFIPWEDELSIPEDHQLEITMFTAKAKQRNVEFGIAGGNIGNKFNINNKTGELFLQEALDYEEIEFYEIWIKVSYERKPLFFSAKKLIINVEDINDNAPKFNPILNHVSVPEGQYPPFTVAQIRASDLDRGSNGIITYRIQHSDHPHMFEIDPESGVLTCNVEMDREKLSEYRMKILAVDSGIPQLSGTATVLLHVEDINDNPPHFSRIYSVNVTENTSPGTLLLQVNTRDNDTPHNANVSYSILEEDAWNVFDIDSKSGAIHIVGVLDRELQEEYSLKVQATDGAWKLDTIISVQVQDENDNTPVFDQPVYKFVYDVESSSPYIGRVHALDRDARGPNSEVIYSLSHSSTFFSVDADNGKILATKKLPFSKNLNSGGNTYHLRVLATDSGKPPRSSECQVLISVYEKEQHSISLEKVPPVLAVPQNLPPDTLIYKIAAKSEENSELTFSIIEGNSPKLFKINSVTGELKTLRLIPHEPGTRLTVNVSVNFREERDALQTFARVNLEVVDDNQHAPKFPSDSIQIYIREDEPVEKEIVTLTATDEDRGLNGLIEYLIVGGNEDDLFKIDKSSGKISVQKELDYEKIPVFNLKVQATDSGFRRKSSFTKVKIVLQDVNDNPPYFESDHVEGFILENSDPGSLVTQIKAFDDDSPIHSKIEFSFLEDQEDFKIDSASGIVMSTRPFDYEQEQSFSLTVQARNPGSDLKANLDLTIRVTGENEFVPRFAQKDFQFVTSESSPVGKIVGRVEAEDQDYGREGEVLYFFVGNSNAAGFAIDRRTGEISVNEKLDRESQSRHVLRVLAKNHGSIRGNDTDEAQVIIQVQDGNDPPVFRNSTYHVQVSEDANVGTRVVVVSAVDEDVKPVNSLFSYAIAAGNGGDAFSIDSRTGEIDVAGYLDREETSYYNLTIHAIDKGSPAATGSAMVMIEIEDINDSAPQLLVTSGSVRENSAPDSLVMQLAAKDDDLTHNAGPFRFKLDNSPSSSFFHLDETSGVLRTRITFDREEKSRYNLNVQVVDSGNPPMSDVFPLTVDILDENDNPSAERQIEVIIKNFKGIFPGGKISDLRPLDPDITGNYHCKLIEGPDNIFNLDENCTVTAGRIQNGREYEMKVSASDGRHPSVPLGAKLSFVPFSQYARDQSVVVRFSNTTEEKVLHFFENLQSSSENKLLDLLSLAATDEGSTIDSLLALTESDLVLSKTETINYLNRQFSIASKFFVPSQVRVNYEPCDSGPCQNGGKCSSKSILSETSGISEYKDTIFNYPKFQQIVTCKCKKRYIGEFCEHQRDVCDPNPCLVGGKCISDGPKDFQCLCPPLRGGKRCEHQSINACQANPCLNGGTCRGKRNTEFFCLCRPGYQGDRCQNVVDYCSQNPCLNGGTCVSNSKPNYRCRCLDNYYGNHCEMATIGFEEMSYVALPSLDPNTNDISVIFTTTNSQALLVYNFGRAVGGRSDFLSLEISDGKPRLSWGGARTAITRIGIDRKVNNIGRWYKLTATRQNHVATLSLEDCTESGEYCKTCNPDDKKCFQRATGEAGTLTFHGNPLFFGGLSNVDDYLERFEQVNSIDFVGCVKGLSLNGFEQDLFTDAINRTGLTNTCNQVEGGPCSGGDECGASGHCIPQWSRNTCQCSGYGSVIAPNCKSALEAFSLTEQDSIAYAPTKRYRRTVKLGKSLIAFDDDFQPEDAASHSIGIAFRTLQDNADILTSTQQGPQTRIEVKDRQLLYRSLIPGKPEINMTTNTDISDGQWHFVLLEIQEGILRMKLDDNAVGYDIEFTAVHNFLAHDIHAFILGKSEESDQGFRGCLGNFTINGQLQTLDDKYSLLEVRSNVQTVVTSGCDIQILQSAKPQSAVDVGITVIIVFFVLLFVLTCFSITFFKLRKKWQKEKEIQNSSKEPGGFTNRGLDIHEGNVPSNYSPQLNNVTHNYNLKPKIPVPQRPDIIESDPMVMQPLPPTNVDPVYQGEAEHYDLENASSIAPSDIDIVYHYKGYRSGNRHGYNSGGKSSHKKKMQKHHNTPLARLSPSSEVSRNTPRILTLGDLSGKPLPPVLMAEQSERSLNSPISHISSTSRHSHHLVDNRGGLTSENVARFNQRSTPQKSTLLNTMDLLSIGSESRKKFDSGTSPALDVESSSSSSDDAGEDDSFTCSEYEYDEIRSPGEKKDSSDVGRGMTFNRLGSPNGRLAGANKAGSSEEENDTCVPETLGKTWESLLNWAPSFVSCSGVFLDIAELSHSPEANDINVCVRPSPVGDRTEEQYI